MVWLIRTIVNPGHFSDLWGKEKNEKNYGIFYELRIMNYELKLALGIKSKQ